LNWKLLKWYENQLEKLKAAEHQNILATDKNKENRLRHANTAEIKRKNTNTVIYKGEFSKGDPDLV